MATVHLPASMKTAAGGETTLTASGATLGELIANLDAAWPGLQSRLAEGERLRPGLAVFVNGVNASALLDTRLPADAEVYFAPAISGG